MPWTTMKRLCLLFFLPILCCADISYKVDFEGLNDAAALKAMKLASQLVTLQSRPPSSVSALRFRAESDIPELLRVLHAYGYYEATVRATILENYQDHRVQVQITPGPLYTLASYEVDVKLEGKAPCPKLELEDLGLTENQPAISKEILEAEKCALRLLSESGYPLATISNRAVVADGKTKTVSVTLEIQSGPLCYFGLTQIRGNTTVKDRLVEQKISWKRGDIYNSALVAKTQKALMDSNLFCAAAVTHMEHPDNRGQLPMDIELTETKHKSISLGASYQKTFGAGATIGWENRNVGGMGRKLSLQADIAQRSHSGVVTYLVPNAWKIGQDLILQAEAASESITAYRDQSYDLFGRLDRQINSNLYFSSGVKGTFLIVSSSVDNGNSLLLEAPIKLRWSNASDFLNPCKGMTFDLRLTPSVNIKEFSEYYFSGQTSLSSYLPLTRGDICLLAQKATIGTIFSNGLNAVPVPRRFFGGSEENLRGYKYLTVSPLNEEGKPIGGRLAFFYNLEMRLRVSNFGFVPFFDLGNVGLDSWLPFNSKWRKSVGIGLRYFSFAGPLRLDVAFPLDRRVHLDPTWWIFVSIGQAF